MFEVDCRLAKSHDFFLPVSSSHELAIDFSRFFEKSNPRKNLEQWGSFPSQIWIDSQLNARKNLSGRVFFLKSTVTCGCRQMRRRAISFLSRWPPTNLTIILSATTKRGVIYLVWRGGRLVDKLSFPALQLTCTRALSYIWRISLPLTHFLLLLPAQDSEFHIFLPFEGWQVCSKPLFVHSVAAQKFPLVAFVYLL